MRGSERKVSGAGEFGVSVDSFFPRPGGYGMLHLQTSPIFSLSANDVLRRFGGPAGWTGQPLEGGRFKVQGDEERHLPSWILANLC